MFENNTTIMNTYKRYDICLDRGKGCKVISTDGTEYLDFVGGIAVMSLGHGNETVLSAIKDQADKLLQCSNLFWSEPQLKLAKLLTAHSFGKNVFFCNSGAEANEAAIKLARKYGSTKHSEGHTTSKKHRIITMENSFHGRTMATLTATGQDKYHRHYHPLVPGFTYVPFNDPAALESAFDHDVCAVILEPLQGEGGLVEASTEFLQKTRLLCDQYDALLIFDEVQCGLGRTGKLFAHQHSGVTPDLMTLSKALGGGLPMGCCIAGEKGADVFAPGDHASTFGGSPIAAAAALASLEVMLDQELPEKALENGDYFHRLLTQLKEDFPGIKEIRGKGLMVGLELHHSAADHIGACHENGLLVCSAGPNIIRFLPPLVVTKDELDQAAEILRKVFSEVKEGEL